MIWMASIYRLGSVPEIWKSSLEDLTSKIIDFHVQYKTCFLSRGQNFSHRSTFLQTCIFLIPNEEGAFFKEFLVTSELDMSLKWHYYKLPPKIKPKVTNNSKLWATSTIWQSSSELIPKLPSNSNYVTKKLPSAFLSLSLDLHFNIIHILFFYSLDSWAHIMFLTMIIALKQSLKLALTNLACNITKIL